MNGEPTNNDRAAWAERALNVFARETYGGRTFSKEVADNPEGDATTMIPDLMCDLMHLARKQGWNPTDLIRQAKANFDAEVDEQANDCAEGRHSWIDLVGKLPADTKCDYCDELYGDPD